ncbi:nucleotide exchange factor GrpE [Pedobacter sp. SYSU D00535]|uniref:nucleotide exchange factor GrpE n=1 Tax=Pedobacter sp. SYSU D00535 TaxID=2810308 RepID=UPI001A957C5C|nr:nucleotide exchange factor GrpE [Pedobacter sp. SYSU D00535]
MLKNKKKNNEQKEKSPENQAQEIMEKDTEQIQAQENQEQATATDTQESASAEDKLRAELAEANDKYVRLYAEFDNFKRRTTKERVELLQTAGKEVILSLLPVLDDFERALKSMETATDVPAVKEGITLVQNKFKNILTQKGLKEMESKGTTFDADLHEAITNIPAPSEDLKGKVIDEVEKGYYLNDKVIRFAKVIVGN